MYIRFESLISKMKVMNGEYLDENWLAEVPCQRTYVPKTGASIGPAVCMQYIINPSFNVSDYRLVKWQLSNVRAR